MAVPVDPAALTNALQALTAVLKKFQYNPLASPTAAYPAAHFNILEAFESVNPVNLGSRYGSYAFAKASAPLD